MAKKDTRIHEELVEELQKYADAFNDESGAYYHLLCDLDSYAYAMSERFKAAFYAEIKTCVKFVEVNYKIVEREVVTKRIITKVIDRE